MMNCNNSQMPHEYEPISAFGGRKCRQCGYVLGYPEQVVSALQPFLGEFVGLGLGNWGNTQVPGLGQQQALAVFGTRLRIRSSEEERGKVFLRSCSQHWLDSMIDIELGLG